MINKLVKRPIILIIRVLCGGANKRKFKDVNFLLSYIDRRPHYPPYHGTSTCIEVSFLLKEVTPLASSWAQGVYQKETTNYSTNINIIRARLFTNTVNAVLELFT